MRKGTSEQVAEAVMLRSLSLRERDRVREKSLIIPLTLTLDLRFLPPRRGPKVRGGEGTCSEVPKTFPKACRYCALTPLCRLDESNARIGRLSLDEPDGEETVDA